jgi:uncharacterized protein YecT (DUF1311 family)
MLSRHLRALAVLCALMILSSAAALGETDETRIGARDINPYSTNKDLIQSETGRLSEACMEASGYGILLCLSDRLEHIDREIEEAYKKALTVVEEPALLTEQHEFWRESRDGDCRVVTTNGENERRCQLASAEDRLTELRNLYNSKSTRKQRRGGRGPNHSERKGG